MTKQIRKSVFETNSSSTHSICVAKNTTIELPESIHFALGTFGWENDVLSTVKDKASYLYTGLVANERWEQLLRICALLSLKGLKVTFEELEYRTNTYKRNDGIVESYNSLVNDGYIDHSYNLSDFLNALEDEDELLRFLFSPLSFIITGNDNDDSDISIDVDCEYTEYYKGN